MVVVDSDEQQQCTVLDGPTIPWRMVQIKYLGCQGEKKMEYWRQDSHSEYNAKAKKILIRGIVLMSLIE